MRSLLALFLFALPAVAAPVPPPPQLSSELLTGVWALEWGELKGGFVCFGDDGTYAMRLGESADLLYVGTWRVDRGEVECYERSYYTPTGRLGGEVHYTIALSTKSHPVLKGTANGVAVVLKRQAEQVKICAAP